MQMLHLRVAAVCAVVCVLVACGGGGGGSSNTISSPPGGGALPPPVATATATPAPASQSVTISLGSSSASAVFPPIASGASGTMVFPATTGGSASATATLQSSLPSGDPAPQAARIRTSAHPNGLGGSVTAIAYVVLTSGAPVQFGQTPTLSFTFPQGTLSGYAYLAFYDPSNASAGWSALLGPVAASGTSLQFANAATLNPPAALSANVPYVYAVVETGTPLPTPTPSPTPTPTASPTPTPTPAPANASPLPDVAAPSGLWGPYDVASALQFPVQSGYNGSGQTVAIVIDSGYRASDLSAYLSYFKIPKTTRAITVRSVDGGSGISADEGETALDVETVAALAPGANIMIYQIPDLSAQSITDAYNAIVSDKYASVATSSFGRCEYGGDPSGSEHTVLAQGASSGIAFIASSGDQGNECSPNGSSSYQVGVEYPASDPNVTGVGGTQTEQPNSLTSPIVWNDTMSANGQAAAGGGVSAYFALPAFQHGMRGVASAQRRNVPDVSMPAEGDAVYLDGSWQQLLGTSWSAPQYAALIAEVYQYCNTTVQSPASIPYDVAARASSAFIDVTSGNDRFGDSSPYYAAGPGYDDASGIGVPLGMPFATAACPNRVPASGMRRPQWSSGFASHAQPATRTMGAPPDLQGMQDLGERPGQTPTRIQLVLRPTATLAADEAAVIGVLDRAGFRIVQTFSNHLVIDAQAPSAVVEAVFATRIHDVSQPRYGVRYSPVTAVTVPASMAPYVAAVNLDNVVRMRTAPR